MERYKAGQVLTYIPLNQRCTVVHNTLGPGGTNEKEAFVTVKLAVGLLQSVPVSVQDAYLTTAPPRKTLKNLYGVLDKAPHGDVMPVQAQRGSLE